MIINDADGIRFSGWDSDLKELKKQGYKIDYKYPCTISPVGEIRCRLRRKDDGHAHSKS